MENELDDNFWDTYAPKKKTAQKKQELLDKMAGSMSKQESDGDHKIVNPDSGATGEWQVMEFNIPDWTQRHYKKRLTPQEFRNNPEAQKAVFYGQMGEYLDEAIKRGKDDREIVRMGAVKWYGGDYNQYDDPTPQYSNGKKYPSRREYTTKVADRIFQAQQQAGNTSFWDTFQPQANQQTESIWDLNLQNAQTPSAYEYPTASPEQVENTPSLVMGTEPDPNYMAQFYQPHSGEEVQNLIAYRAQIQDEYSRAKTPARRDILKRRLAAVDVQIKNTAKQVANEPQFVPTDKKLDEKKNPTSPTNPVTQTVKSPEIQEPKRPVFINDGKGETYFKIPNQENLNPGEARYFKDGNEYIVDSKGNIKGKPDPNQPNVLQLKGGRTLMQSSNQDGLQKGQVRFRDLANDKGGEIILNSDGKGNYSLPSQQIQQKKNQIINPPSAKQTSSPLPIEKQPGYQKFLEEAGKEDSPEMRGLFNDLVETQQYDDEVKNNPQKAIRKIDVSGNPGNVSEFDWKVNSLGANLWGGEGILPSDTKAYFEKYGFRELDPEAQKKMTPEEINARQSPFVELTQADIDDIKTFAYQRRGMIEKNLRERLIKGGEFSEDELKKLYAETDLTKEDIDNFLNAPQNADLKAETERRRKFYQDAVKGNTTDPVWLAELKARLGAGWITEKEYNQIKAREDAMTKEIERDIYIAPEASPNSPESYYYGDAKTNEGDYRKQLDEKLKWELGDKLPSQYLQQKVADENTPVGKKAAEFVKNVYRFFAKLPGDALYLGGQATEYGDRVQRIVREAFTNADDNKIAEIWNDPKLAAAKNGLTDLSNDWLAKLDREAPQDPVLRENFYVTTVPDVLAQTIFQVALGVATGGTAAPLLFGMSQGAIEQSKAAEKGGATTSQKLLVSAIASVLAVPDALLSAKFAGLNPLGKLEFLDTLKRSLLRRFVGEFAETEAKVLTESALKSFSRNLPKNVAFGMAGEGIQESILEGKPNRFVADVTYNNKTWGEAWERATTITKEDIEEFAGGAIGGLAGGTIETAIKANEGNTAKDYFDKNTYKIFPNELEPLPSSDDFTLPDSGDASTVGEKPETKPVTLPKKGLAVNQKVEIEGKGEGTIVEDKGKTVVVDFNDGKSRTIVRKNQITPIVEESPKIDEKSSNPVETASTENTEFKEAEKPQTTKTEKPSENSSNKTAVVQGIQLKPRENTDTVSNATEILKDAGGLNSRKEQKEFAKDIIEAKEGKEGSEAAQAVHSVIEEYKPNEDKSERKFSSTQVDFPEAEANEVRAFGKKLISDEDLHENGREDRPHFTTKFGLTTKDAEKVRPLVENIKPFKVKLGKTFIFENEDFDVVNIGVENSPELEALNKIISENLPNKDTHPNYVIHAALAYVKKGEGQKYVGNPEMEGKEVEFNGLTFSGKDRVETFIPFAGKQDAANIKTTDQITSHDGQYGSVTKVVKNNENKPESTPKRKLNLPKNDMKFGQKEILRIGEILDQNSQKGADENEFDDLIKMVAMETGLNKKEIEEVANKEFQRRKKKAESLQNAENESKNKNEVEKNAESNESGGNDNRSDEIAKSDSVQGTEPKRRTADVRGNESGSGDGNLLGNDERSSGQSSDLEPAASRENSTTDDGEQTSSGNSDSPSNRISARRGNDYVAPANSLSREGSWRETAKRNLDIIELVKKLESENRLATPEEQSLLVKFTGWGASEIANNLFPGFQYWGEIRPEQAREGWKELAQRAKDLFTPDELKTAARSTRNAHYTSESIIRGIWNAVSQFGFSGGRVLEPGMGVGLFGVAAPESIFSKSHYTGIERDSMTARIAKQILQNQAVLENDFVKQNLPDNFFDVAIGNPPFSDTKILNDPRYKKYRFMTHDYFFAKSIDKVRPGGILVFVTSKGTMDKTDAKMREYISERADLLGAIRLPQTAFKENAGTEVVTDVLFFRKRMEGEEIGGESWINLSEITAKNKQNEDHTGLINEYFVNHPEMVLGNHAYQGSMYKANEYTVIPNEGNIDEQFRVAIEKLPSAVYASIGNSEEIVRKAAERDHNPKHIKEGSLYIHEDGRLMRKEFGVGVELKESAPISANEEKWLKSYVNLRTALKEAQSDQLKAVDENDTNWQKSLAALNAAYDAFVKKHGNILEFSTYERTTVKADGTEVTNVYRRYRNNKVLNFDVESPLVEALETITEDGQIVKSPILLDRTIKPPQKAEIKELSDALAVSLDTIGKLNLAHVAELYKTVRSEITKEDVIKELGDAIFETPSGEWQLADEYLSGFVIDKLEEAELAAKSDPKFQRNVDALLAVQPAPLETVDITPVLGAAWVGPQVTSGFAREVLGLKTDSVTFEPMTNTWYVNGADGAGSRGLRDASNEWGTSDRSPNELLDAALNNRTVKITFRDSTGKVHTDVDASALANEKIKNMKDAFRRWIWTDAKRSQQITEKYNRIYNNIAPRFFDGSHLSTPGLSSRYKLHPHQKRAVWRVLQTGNTYLAHAVGAGKTLEMIVSGMEQKRLGLISKPMYVVPNHMLKQFSSEFLEAYPLANILVADENNFSKEKRQAFTAQAALNDLDAVIITHSAFGLIRTKPETADVVIDEMVNQMRMMIEELDENDRAEKRTIKDLENRIEKLEQKFGSLADATGKDDVVHFEDLGVDFVYVDEAHEFRKLDFVTNRVNVKGIDPKGSQRSLDLLIKLRWLESQRPGRSAVLASGTPITNTLAELYSIMRYLDPAELETAELSHFDAWSSQFGEAVADYEMNAAGNYEIVERFSRFVNIPELMKRARKFMDVLTLKQLGSLISLPTVKGGSPEIVVVKATEEQNNYLKGELASRIEASRKWKPSPGNLGNPDPLINIITDGRLAAIDMRFVDSEAENDPNSKLNVMIDKIIEKYQESKDFEYRDKSTGEADAIKGATQIVFSAVGFGEQVAAKRGFDAKAWMLKRLTEAGIPLSEIAFMGDYKTATAKERMFREMRQGTKKILVGSPKNMGTGVNVQKRLWVEHYLSPPWYPSDVEQPDGRIIRQGNQNSEVEIYRYATKGTYDSTAWAMIARKSRAIEQAMTGDDSQRSLEDISESSQYEMASAVSAGDDRAIKLAGLRRDIEKLERLRGAHGQEQRTLGYDLRRSQGTIEFQERKIADFDAALKLLGKNFISNEEFSLQIGGLKLEKRSEIGQRIIGDFALAIKNNKGKAISSDKEISIEIGKALGKFPLKVNVYASSHGVKGRLTLEVGNVVSGLSEGLSVDDILSSDPVGIATRVYNALNSVAKKRTESLDSIATEKRKIKQIESKLGQPFADEQELYDKIAEYAQLQAEMAGEGLQTNNSQNFLSHLNQQLASAAIGKVLDNYLRKNPVFEGQETEPFTLKSVLRENDEINLDSLYNEDGDIDYEQLKNLSDGIERGDLAIARLNPEEERGRIEGGRRNVEASIIAGANDSSRRGDGTRSRYLDWQEHKRLVEDQEKILEKYAKEQNIWFDYDSLFKDYKYFRKGMESRVFFDKKEGYLIKAVGYDFARKQTPLEYLDNRISLHNYLFPGTKYELLGFTRDDGGFFRFVVRQQFIQKEGQISDEELEKYLTDNFNADKTDGAYEFANDRYVIGDLRKENIIKSKSGIIHFIDPILSFNEDNVIAAPFAVRSQNQANVEGFSSASFNKELESIKLNYDQNGKILAKNGRISNIQNERLAKTIRTADFKNWFGDWENNPQNASKIVDENGEPLIVKHGTSASNFAEFNTLTENELGAHFGTSEQANEFTRKNGGNLIPAFLNIRNPLETADIYGDLWETNYALANKGILEKTAEETGYSATSEYTQNKLKEAGYDGLRYPNLQEGLTEKDLAKKLEIGRRELMEMPFEEVKALLPSVGESFVIFDKNQVKSIFNQGSFDPDVNDTLKSVYDDYVNETEKMTVEKMKQLPFVSFDELLASANIERFGDRIKANAESHEIFRRAFEQARIESGQTKPGSTDTEDLFGAIFIPPQSIAKTVEILQRKATEAQELGYSVQEIAVFTQHAEMLQEAAKDNTTAIIYILDKALPEEIFHQADYLGAMEKSILARHEENAAQKLDNHRISQVLWMRHFSRFNEYKRLSPKVLKAVLRAEIAPFITEMSDADLAKYGITKDERDDYLLTWFEGYAAKNGIESLDNFEKEELNVQEFIEKIKEAHQIRQNGQGNEESLANEGKQSGETRRGPPSSGSGQNQRLSAGGKSSAVDEPNPNQNDTDSVKNETKLGKNEKLASLPKTLRAAGIDADDVIYEVFGDKRAQESARKMLDENGIEGAIKLLRSIKTPDADHAILSFMIQRILLDNAAEISSTNPTEAENLRALALKLGREHALKAVSAGRFTRAASIVQKSVEGVMYAVQGVVNDVYGEDKTLSPEEWARIEAKAREGEESLAKIEALKKEKINLQRKIKRLEDEKEGKKKTRRSKASLASRKKIVELIKDKNGKRIDELRKKLLEKLAPVGLKSIVGENANLDPITVAKLESAKHLESQGKSANDIYFATGWERGADGKWRTDLPGKFQVNYKTLRSMLLKGTVEPLDFVLDAPELFAAYPSLRNIAVAFEKMPKGDEAYFNAESLFIALSNELKWTRALGLTFNRGGGLTQNLKHEIQHAIQEIENFSKGANSKKSSFENYRKKAGEVEARNAETRMDLSREQLSKTPISQTEDISRSEQIFDIPLTLKSVLNDEGGFDEETLNEFAEIGAMFLIEGLATENEYLPEDFHAQMIGEFGDVIGADFQKIYERAWKIRDGWLSDIRTERTRENIRQQYEEELEDWQIDEILGERKEKAVRRRALEVLHRVAANRAKLTPGEEKLAAKIDEIAPTDEIAESAKILATGGTRKQVYEALKNISEVEKEKVYQNAVEVLSFAKKMKVESEESDNPITQKINKIREEVKESKKLGKAETAEAMRKLRHFNNLMEKLNKVAAIPQAKAISDIIVEIDNEVNTAVAASLIAYRAALDDIYMILGISDRKQQREILRKANQVFEEAKAEYDRRQKNLLQQIANAKDELRSIGDLQWQARQRSRQAAEAIAQELKRIKSGELSYRANQIIDVLSASRTLMASFDLSAALRQGGYFSFSKPEMQKEAFANMFKSFKTANYGQAIQAIEGNPRFTLAQRAGVDFAEAGRSDTDHEELYRGKSTLEKIPLLGKFLNVGITGWSERTYTAFLDTQRMVIFDALAQELEAMGLTFERNKKEFEKIAEFINVATGRGTMPESQLGKILLELPLFAPRYTLSRLQLLNMTLNPMAYYNMPPAARKIIAKSAFRFYGTTAALLFIPALLGLVGFDPEDDEFLKIKVGNTRYDIFAGELQPARMILKLVHSAIVTKGGQDNRVPGEFWYDTMDLDKGAIPRFLRGKLSPIPSLVWDATSGKDFVGNEFSWGKAIGSRLFPITFFDIYEAAKLDGMVGVARSLPFSFFGVGVNNYKERFEKPKTAAERLAVKAVAMKLPSKPQTEEEKAQRDRIQEMTYRSRSGEYVTAEVKEMAKAGLIPEDKVDDIINAKNKTYLVDKAENLSLEEFTAVFRAANAKEKEQLLPLLNKKMKNADVDGKLTETQKADLQKLGGRVVGDVKMPDDVKSEFERFGIKTPDVGETISIKKGEKTKLSDEQYEKYRKEALERIYKKVQEKINSEAYMDANEHNQEKMIRSVINKARSKELQENKRQLKAPEFQAY